MIQGLITILATLLVITILVFVHELGHFLAAKLFKVNVNEFAIGFGKRIFSKKFKGTIYSIRLLPLGGFVDLEGETDSTSPNSFRNIRAFKKIIILTAGVFMNVVFAMVAMTIFLASNGYQFTLPSLTSYNFNNTTSQIEAYPIYITEVDEDGNSAGQLNPGDVIISIDNNRFKSYSDFQNLLDVNQNKVVSFEFLNLDNLAISSREIRLGSRDENGAILNTTLFELNRNSSSSYPAYYLKYNQNFISGISLTSDLLVYIPKSLGNIIVNSFRTGDFNELGNSVGGPLQIVDNSNQIVESGFFEAFVPLAGLLSISLAIFNILPFPALDGGQIVVVLIEKIIRRKIPDSILEKINLFGLVFLFGLAGLLTFKDFIQLNIIDKVGELFRNIAQR